MELFIYVKNIKQVNLKPKLDIRTSLIKAKIK